MVSFTRHPLVAISSAKLIEQKHMVIAQQVTHNHSGASEHSVFDGRSHSKASKDSVSDRSPRSVASSKMA